MTRFVAGDKVQATVNTPQLREGVVYEVVEVREQQTFAGNFVCYCLRVPGQDTITEVYNGHLLLTEVEG